MHIVSCLSFTLKVPQKQSPQRGISGNCVLCAIACCLILSASGLWSIHQAVQMIEPPYRLFDCDCNEWRFQESDATIAATGEFDALLERLGGIFRTCTPPLADALREFLERHPNHIDALHHYSSCLSREGKFLDSFAFSETAVTVGMRTLPKIFEIGRDRLPTGFVQNRPFLRALHGLMLAQRNLNLIEDAIETGEMCLALDRQDRMGARESLVYYFLESGRDASAVALFESEAYKETFFAVEYLHPLALIRLGREEEARTSLERCLHYYPQVARFILNQRLPRPKSEDAFGGVTSGSELEGWIHGRNFSQHWRSNEKSLKLLRQESRPYAKEGWKRWQGEVRGSSAKPKCQS
jgi:tetratricopeptide (TPR) repeat protein